MTKLFRIEHDNLGSVKVKVDSLWGAQTQRSLNNFAIGNERIPTELIHAMALIKKSCAIVNAHRGILSQDLADKIVIAADAITSGIHDDQFPLKVWQTGSGTQTNMNVNEVISNLVSRNDNEPLGSYQPVHPNDHVNRSQSTNDVFPAAIHVATAQQLTQSLLPAIETLIEAFDVKAQAWNSIVKIGRTHLQDAVPLRLGDEVSAWRDQLDSCQEWIKSSLSSLGGLPLGGTAVGTGLNAPKGFGADVAKVLCKITGLPFRPADNLFAVMAGHDALVHTMSQLRGLAVALLRIANDIRLLGCGPRAGLGELRLPANEPGSSIMPGKINPTQCEAITMVCTQVIGLDVAVAAAGAGGHLQMNVFKPLIGFNLLQAVRLLSSAIKSFRQNLVEGLEPDCKQIQNFVEQSLMLVTALTPRIGYEKASAIAQHAHKQGLTLKQSALELNHVSDVEFDRLVDPVKMAEPQN
ncbi:class II fumarate hydratase [Synechococcus sp. M16CYN]|uniref:class II fumarate hydratase n=1 Tax=Synechococcus sp. M16CYN TaxID=3103139 RepID=UPI00324C6800